MTPLRGVSASPTRLAEKKKMAQRIQTSFVCDGRYRVHMIDAVGGHPARIIEIEEVDTRQRYHGSPSHLRRMLAKLCHSYSDEISVAA
jgi:hypothetical protein